MAPVHAGPSGALTTECSEPMLLLSLLADVMEAVSMCLEAGDEAAETYKGRCAQAHI